MWYTTYAARTGRQQKTMRAKTHKAPAARTTSNSRSIQTLNELTSMCFMYVGEQSVIIILGSPGLTSRKYVEPKQSQRDTEHSAVEKLFRINLLVRACYGRRN